jgi:hypothetical protein
MKKLIKYLSVLLVGTMLIAASQVQSQPANLVLQDTTIATAATFTALNSITAGPNFTIAGNGDVTFHTNGRIYLRPGIVIIQGGRFRATRDSATVDVRPHTNPTVPAGFALQQNYPNPFNPSTTIKFELPMSTRVSLVVYDLLGKEVTRLVDEIQDAGYKSVLFNAANLPTGVYFYRLEAGSFMSVRKLMLVK